MFDEIKPTNLKYYFDKNFFGLSKIRWPGEGDSNSRRYDPHRFSRPAHSTTLTSPDIGKEFYLKKIKIK